MKPKATPTVELTLESPCPGRLDDLLAVFVDRNGAERTTAASTRSHAATCLRCRAFLESQRTLRPLVERAFDDYPRTSSPVPFSSIRGFETWLSDAIGLRDKRELANVACEIANAVLSLDHDFSVKTFLDTDSGDQASRDPIGALEHLVPELVARLDRSAHSTATSIQPRNKRVLRESLRAIDHELRFASRSHQIHLAHRLLLAANEIGTRRTSTVHIALANLEWHWGEVPAVPAHLDQAMGSAENLFERSQALTNLSVWYADRGFASTAFAYARSALESRPSKPITLLNTFMWQSITGDRHADRSLSRLMSTSQGRRVLLLQPTRWYDSTLTTTGERFSVAASTATKRRLAALRSLNDAKTVAEQTNATGR